MDEELRPPPQDTSWLQLEDLAPPWWLRLLLLVVCGAYLWIMAQVAIFLFSNHN